jgi:hypothetical protein
MNNIFMSLLNTKTYLSIYLSVSIKEEVCVYACMYVCMYPIDAQTAQRNLMKFAWIVYHVPKMVFVKFSVNPSTGIRPTGS